jgi:hypothetical protein
VTTDFSLGFIPTFLNCQLIDEVNAVSDADAVTMQA